MPPASEAESCCSVVPFWDLAPSINPSCLSSICGSVGRLDTVPGTWEKPDGCEGQSVGPPRSVLSTPAGRITIVKLFRVSVHAQRVTLGCL